MKKQLQVLGLVKLPSGRFKFSGEELHNYTLPLSPPEHYPRVHFITSNRWDETGYYRLIEIHVDIVRHTQTEVFHPAIDRIAKIIKHTK